MGSSLGPAGVRQRSSNNRLPIAESVNETNYRSSASISLCIAGSDRVTAGSDYIVFAKFR